MAVKRKPTKKVPVKKTASPSSPYSTQIAAESTMKFSPERTALGQALDDVISQRAQEISAAHSAAQGGIATARAAVPTVQAALQQALGVVDETAPMTGAAGASELARSRGLLATRMASAVADLGQRQTDYSAGEQYAVNAANARAGSSAAKVRTQLIDLATREGAYAASRSGDLALQDRKLDQQAMGQLLSAGLNPDTGKPLAGGRLDPDANGLPGDQVEASLKQARTQAAKRTADEKAGKAPKRATQVQMGAARKEIQRALVLAAQGVKQKQGRHTVAQTLLQGLPEIPEKAQTVSKLAPDGSSVSQRQVLQPGSPAFKAVDPLLASVALDLAYDGAVSRANVKRLHRAGYTVSDLQVLTQTQRHRTSPTVRHATLSPAERAPGGT